MSQSSIEGEHTFWKAGKHWVSGSLRYSIGTTPSPVAPAPVSPQRAMLANDPETREDAQATIGAFKELGPMGPEYEDAVVDAFLARLDTRLAEQQASQPQPPPNQFSYPVRFERAKPPAPVSSAWTFGQTIAFVSIVLGMAIPLTAIAASMLGVVGLIAAWIGIAAVAGTAKAKFNDKGK
jgi:hypothetical protein